uniref:neuromedin-U isoform X2 n=1 Tax=Halichoerus grypus TaxID=9711 RepID=UPI001659015C|nr:neuromedin-U isoform X2 [Halichoerus grypus]
MEVAEPPASMGRASPEAPGWQWPVPSLRGRREGSGGRDLSTPLRTDAVHEKVHSVLIQLFCTLLSAHPGAPVLFQGLQPEEELQLWNEIDDACSTLLSLDSQPQASNALEELCITIMGTLPKPQETDEKIIPKVLISLFEDTEIGQFKCCATQWKKFRRLHLKWITNYFPQKRHQGMQNVNIFFSSQKQSLLNLSCLRIPVL